MSRNLSALLERSLPLEQLELLRRAADEASRQGFPLYIVGGFVRDLVLGRPSLDFDLVVEGDSIALARALAERYGGKVTAHPRFGTAKWHLRGARPEHSSTLDALDFISARSEVYKHPAALPTVKMGKIEDDIRRRDFTINTLAIRLDGKHFGILRDEVGGLEDIERGRVRVLHARAFLDDPTRMYRAVRYEQRYGFHIVPETLNLIPEARPLIARLSPKRIRHELDLILDEPDAASMLKRLEQLDLLRPIHPSLSRALGLLDPSIYDGQPRLLRWVLWLLPLSPEEIEALNTRLHFPAALMRSLRTAPRLFADLSAFAGLPPSEVVRRLDGLPEEAIRAAALAATAENSKRPLQEYLSTWRHLRPKTTGHDLKRLGLREGPQYQQILWKLRAAWLDGRVATEQDEQRLLQALLQDSLSPK